MHSARRATHRRSGACRIPSGTRDLVRRLRIVRALREGEHVLVGLGGVRAPRGAVPRSMLALRKLEDDSLGFNDVDLARGRALHRGGWRPVLPFSDGDPPRRNEMSGMSKSTC